MGGTDTPTAARRLEIFLDRVAELAADDVSFLLDSLKTDSDQRLAEDLVGLAGRVGGTGAAHAAVEGLLRSLGWRPI